MARKAMLTVGGTYHKVKKQYLTVGGLYRKVKKGFVTIGGTYRPYFTGGELAYYGTIAGSSLNYEGAAATSVGNYALFGGGGSEGTSLVTACSKSLTISNPTNYLQGNSMDLAATSVGNYALFGGGYYNGSARNYLTAYDTSLTRTLPDSLRMASYELAAATVSNHAIFTCGRNPSNTTGINITTIYDSSLTQVSITSSNQPVYERYALAGVSFGNYALFGGGKGKSTAYYSKVDCFDSSLTTTLITDLSVGRFFLAAAKTGDQHALFAGGTSNDYNKGYSKTTVDAFDQSLVRTNAPDLSKARHYISGASVDQFALFAGGYDGSSRFDTVESYDSSLTKKIETTLPTTKSGMCGTSVGDYALFGGYTEYLVAYVVA